MAFDLIKELNPEVTSYKDSNVTVGRVYHYRVIAVSAGCEGLYARPISGVPFGLPGAPEQVAATAEDGKVRLKWNPPKVDGGRPVTGYTVSRSEPGVPLRVLAELGGVLSYVDVDVINGKTYGYVVRAVNEAGMGEASGAVEATPAKQVGVPGAVQSPRAEAKGGSVLVTWGPPASDGGSPVTGYVVLRGTGPGNLTMLAEVGAMMSYTDTTVERGRTYYYIVVAKNAAGQGERSGSALEAKVPEKGTKGSPGPMVAAAAAALVLAGAALRRGRREGTVTNRGEG